MGDLQSETDILFRTEATTDRRAGWLAAVGLGGALLVSSCCILPLVLVTLGISGAWVGSLTVLEPYKPLFLTSAAIFLGLGYWRVYFRTRPLCAEGSYCARSSSSRLTKVALWGATVLVISTATINWWAPLFY